MADNQCNSAGRLYTPFDDPQLDDDAKIAWCGSEISLHESQPDKRWGGNTWQERYPEIIRFLEEHRLTPQQAVEHNREWMSAKKTRSFQNGTVVRSWGSDRSKPHTVAAIETAEIDRGEAPQAAFIENTYYRIVRGEQPSVCPKAHPQISEEHAKEIAERLRSREQLQADETVHWIGSKRGLDYLCACDMEWVGLPTSGKTTVGSATQKTNGKSQPTKPNDGLRHPKNPDVRDLCAKLSREVGKGTSEIDIARNYTGGDEKKAKSLIRQARRFKHLWKR